MVAAMGATSWVLASLCLAALACGSAREGKGDAGVSTDATAACSRPGPRTVRQLAAGSGYSLAVLDDGDVVLWGSVLGHVGVDGKPRQRLAPPFSVDTGCRQTVEV